MSVTARVLFGAVAHS